MSGEIDYVDGEPIPQLVALDQILIFDPIEFADLTNSIAVNVVEGPNGNAMMVLDKDSLLWRVVGVPTVRSIR